MTRTFARSVWPTDQTYCAECDRLGYPRHPAAEKGGWANPIHGPGDPLTETEQAWERGYDRGYTVGKLAAAGRPLAHPRRAGMGMGGRTMTLREMTDPLPNVLGVHLSLPCDHGWRRWRDRLTGREHTAWHSVFLPAAAEGAPLDSQITIRYTAAGTFSIEEANDD